MIIIISLSILLVICICIIWNLLRKVESVEEAYRELSISNITIVETVQKTLIEMQKIDDKGAFQSDDEVGVIFKQLLDVLIAVDSLATEDTNE